MRGRLQLHLVPIADFQFLLSTQVQPSKCLSTMIKTGRNDPCPCGSGKKYKKCCLVPDEDSDFQYRRFRQIHSGLIPKLMTFAFEIIEAEVVEEAWKEFNDYEAVEDFDPDGPLNVLFMPWFLFNWIIELKPAGRTRVEETTIAELFLLDRKADISADEEMLLRSSIRCPYTLYEAVEVRPGVGMTLFDLLRRITHVVVEHSASETLKRGEIIYCATTQVAGFRSNVGMGPYALRPTAKGEVFALRKWIVNGIGSEEIRTEHLHEFEQDIRGLYLDTLKGMFAPPSLANTDGDPFLPQKLYFDLKSADLAFQGLKSLAGGDENDLLEQATLDNGLIVKAEIPWLGGSEEARSRLGGPVLLGLLKIDQERLIVEVNSKQRAELIRGLVEDRLGDTATYKTTLIEPMESRVNEMWNAAAAGSSSSSDPEDRQHTDLSSYDQTQPEIMAMMEEVARQHWESWFDLPVPALNDMTPREAAQTEEGRELLESLLLFYENTQSDSAANVLNADIPALRRELGME
uniref:Antitoxin Xre/MbcA/ParS-like toxin-binding domain-containing protein n=1 Tax=uncultured Acidobacteriota bacterium TaxID=171953 RepID=Q7X2U0_9BACT|nr:hypothetical protein [uncultured Acidobacteriota bacterium]